MLFFYTNSKNVDFWEYKMEHWAKMGKYSC